MHHDHGHEWTVVGPPSLAQSSSSSSSSSAAEPAAQHQVLHTPELLEKILASCGDMRAVLLAQRVSLFWHDLIRSSSLLQCMLYLEPVPPFAPDEGLSPEELWDTFSLNPLLSHYFPGWLQQHERPGALNDYSAPKMCGVVSFAKGRCCREGDENVSTNADEGTVGGAGGEPGEQGDSGGGEGEGSGMSVVPPFPPERREAFTRAGASWRRMLVCQPASMGLGFKQTRPATVPRETDLVRQRRPWPNPGWWQEPVVEEEWEFLTQKQISGFLDTSLEAGVESEEMGDAEGGGLRMGTLFDVCLQQYLYYSPVERRARHEHFQLHWMPPGHLDLFPYEAMVRNYGGYTPGLGVSVFVVLEDVAYHHGDRYDERNTKIKLLTTEQLETFRCEEHRDRQFTPLQGW